MSEYQLPPMEDYESNQFAWMGLSNMRSSLSAKEEIDMRNHIAEQAEEIATLKAALNASNAALAEARKFVKKVANEKVVDADAMRNPYESAYRGYKAEAKSLVASWDSAVAATTQDAPQQEVTLTDIEIEWLAKHVSNANENRYYSRESAENNWRKPPSQVNRVVVLSPTGITYALAPKYDTPANRAAIEARRKKESE